MRLNPALFTAASRGRTSEVRQLLEQRADVSAQASGGYSALIESAMKGHDRVVQLLLDKRADVTAKLEDGYSALHFGLTRQA